jgi:hypothetical protein
VVSVTPLPLYPRHPLNKTLGGSQNRSGLYGGVKILDTAENGTLILGFPALARRRTEHATAAPVSATFQN